MPSRSASFAVHAVIAVIAVLVPPFAAPQSLGQVAAREQDRRPRQSPGVPSYDDYDLQKGKPPSPSPSPSPSVRPSPTPSPAGARSPRGPRAGPTPGRVPGARATPQPTPRPPTVGQTPLPAQTPVAPPPAEASEAYWRARASSHREALRAAEQRVTQLESEVARLRNDRSPTNVMDASREQNRQAALGRAIADLEQAQASVIRARQALDDLEDEARRKGALPGWLRER